jgi:hypothetical protein
MNVVRHCVLKSPRLVYGLTHQGKPNISRCKNDGLGAVVLDYLLFVHMDIREF